VLRAILGRSLKNVELAYPALRAAGWDRPRFVAARAELEKGRPAVANAL
jgi:hypothetical protein